MNLIQMTLIFTIVGMNCLAVTSENASNASPAYLIN